jgi:hypothetical protein
MTSGRVYIELVEDSRAPCNISLSGSLLPSAYTSEENIDYFRKYCSV